MAYRSDTQQISDYLDQHDPDGDIQDYTIIDGQVRYIPTCPIGELYGYDDED